MSNWTGSVPASWPSLMLLSLVEIDVELLETSSFEHRTVPSKPGPDSSERFVMSRSPVALHLSINDHLLSRRLGRDHLPRDPGRQADVPPGRAGRGVLP